MYIYATRATSSSSPPTRNRGAQAGTIHVSVYRKLRGGSVKSSALNGTGQTYAETYRENRGALSRSRESISRRALMYPTLESTRKTYKTPTAVAITRVDSLRAILFVYLSQIYSTARLVSATR